MATSAALEQFIAQHGLDERVSKGLRELTPMGQQQVMGQDLTAARNPSAVVWSRVCSAQTVYGLSSKK